MTDNEILDGFTAVQYGPQGVVLRVRRITWRGPHQPRSRWQTASILPTDISPTDIEVRRRQLLNNSTYFRVCAECQERVPVGFMHGGTICQSCAQRNHSVVY